MTNLDVGIRSRSKQDRFPPDCPYVMFQDMLQHKMLLYPNQGYKPLRLKMKMFRTNKSAGVVVVEYAMPPAKFKVGSGEVQIYDVDGRGGRLFKNEFGGAGSNQEVQFRGSLVWESANLSVVGDSNLVAGNKITIANIDTWYFFNLLATGVGVDFLRWPTFRVRRSFDTAVSAEVLGVGTGAKTHFEVTAAKVPICPGSVRISFTDSVGAKVDKIVDNGRGILACIPPDLLLDPNLKSTIDYKTGAIVLDFDAAHIPTATNITIDYEYDSAGIADESEYGVEWDIEEF